MVRIVVDGREIFVDEGKSLLQGCLDHGIFIPNLCYLEDMEDPPGSCRMCFVEIEGMNQPVVSCKVEPKPDMVVNTSSSELLRLQRTSLRLLLSNHEAKCKACPSNRRCILQELVKRFGVRIRPRRYDHIDREVAEDIEHPLLQIVHSRCILCGKCVHVCQRQYGSPILTYARRGIDTIITAFGDVEAMYALCETCLACVEVCPVSALLLREPSGAIEIPADGSPEATIPCGGATP
ncbi:MAG: 2Fe-2S iron-sulfur cluster binding domain-containing protein [Deltaproteobacteria bacterium]|nr:2Fe-2S iron-sulfur cluster binding domain-containing protein [Deltaproteobacteria bacterium]